ncbi:hypothetical protein HN51_071817 [Arachis hypogaea]|uniref:uncharacterized protein n=1 Tax=Arachis hypogaea TaxID=3818 RepID=UPI0007AF154F|nr:uncharacterized protein LOC107644961 isoform X2 [Arachis ipaensis]XP_025657073.1 uncharacterized protein LOC112751952 [Arachis hypogaea]QHO14453.1 uncharacterized protein DS421_15g524320 [Arachis hypogaea]
MMESAETGECLWMVTDDYIFGIRVEKLEKLGKNEDRDWKSHLEKAPIDFRLILPESCTLPRYFIFDSKLFLVGNQTHSGTKIHQISYVGGDTLGTSEAVATGAIPPLPIGFFSFLANIKDDVYLLEHGAAPHLAIKTGLWVLSPRLGSPNWHSMPAPPTEVESHNELPYGFVLNDKLLLHPWTAPGVAFVYYPEPKKWIKLERALSLPDYSVFLGVSSLGDVDDRSVVLTWNPEGLSGPGVKYEIHTLLVDNKDYCILRHQFLDELCEAIQPSYFDDGCSNLDLVDLGNSKVCVIIGGLAEGIPSLCILVVELGLVQEKEQQRFLSVRLLVNRVFDMRPYFLKDRGVQVLCTSFLFSLSNGTLDIDRDSVKDHIGEKVPTLTSASLEAFSRKRSSGEDGPSTEGDNVVKVAQSKGSSLKRRELESGVVGLDKYVEVSQLKDKARELGMKDMTEALEAKEKESEEMVKQITTLQSQLKGRDEKIEALTLKVCELENALKDAKNSKEPMAYDMFGKGFDRARTS